MNTLEQYALDALDEQAMLSLLFDLIAIPSLDGSPEELAVQERVAQELRSLGMDVDVWELDFASLRQHPSFSWETERSHGLGVVGALGSGKGKSLILNGHTDVVPAGDSALWQYPPWQGSIADGRVYGRGALDMKGGLCCGIAVARALREAGIELDGRLLIQSVIGEEDGGCGMLATIMRGHTADAAIIMEPTELCIAPAQAGALNFRLYVPGLAAHGCVREEGVSAIEQFFPIYAALMELEHERNAMAKHGLFARYELPYGLCIGRLEAGNWASTVAEELRCEGRYGVAVGEDLLTARRLLEARVAQAAQASPWLREHPPRVEWWGGQFAPASIPVDHPIVTVVAQADSDLRGAPARIEGMTYGADMRLLVNDGHVPTVMYGPGDVRRAHKANEWVGIDELVTVARTLMLTTLRFCGAHQP